MRYGSTLCGVRGGVAGGDLHNEELMCGLWENEEIVVAERLRVDKRAQAQMRKFANLVVELMAGQ